jgi:hypothetical protein
MNKQSPSSGPYSVIDTPLNIKPSKEAGGPDVPANESGETLFTPNDVLGIIPAGGGKGKHVGPKG